MKSDVALGICDQGIGSSYKQVAAKRLIIKRPKAIKKIFNLLDDVFVLVLTRPHKWCPATFILEIDELPCEVVLGQDDMDTLQVTVLSCQMKASHPIVSTESQVGTSSQ